MTLIQKHLTTVIISAQTHLAVTTVAVTKDMSFLQMDTHALVANIMTQYCKSKSACQQETPLFLFSFSMFHPNSASMHMYAHACSIKHLTSSTDTCSNCTVFVLGNMQTLMNVLKDLQIAVTFVTTLLVITTVAAPSQVIGSRVTISPVRVCFFL